MPCRKKLARQIAALLSIALLFLAFNVGLYATLTRRLERGE